MEEYLITFFIAIIFVLICYFVLHFTHNKNINYKKDNYYLHDWQD